MWRTPSVAISSNVKRDFLGGGKKTCLLKDVLCVPFLLVENKSFLSPLCRDTCHVTAEREQMPAASQHPIIWPVCTSSDWLLAVVAAHDTMTSPCKVALERTALRKVCVCVCVCVLLGESVDYSFSFCAEATEELKYKCRRPSIRWHHIL